MKEYVEEFKDELKRVDHLIYVSLKYTRTVDVLKNVILRLVNSFEILINGIVKEAHEKGILFEIPQPAIHKCEEVKKLYPQNEVINEFIDFYILLRKIAKNEEYDSINEFRRHVAFIIEVDGETIEVCIDLVTEYYKKAMQLMEHLIEIVG
ncbi:hypothetical protein HYY69_07400 [Candidatus Woesearchaeota archaeon]|nr:hypothetical protein [Candidatus Woesearchaeota archaeon]